MNSTCFHCGNLCEAEALVYDSKDFCCNGCKTVYQILSEHDLTSYYDLEKSPGARPKLSEGKFDFLDNQKVVEQLLEFNDADVQIINLYIPHIHCSSCIWVLENLNKISKAITSAQVNFPKKTVRICYSPSKITLKEVVILLANIGYEPYISLEDYTKPKRKQNSSMLYKLGVAGFAFGNVMLLSFPEYFEVNEYWLNQYKPFFRWIMFAMSVPVVFYAAQDYFISAYKGLQSKLLNIDVPIALGILVLFFRSVFEITTNTGQGFFDSLTGLVFFLLLGKFFQQKTYNFLSFERDYKSYFPIGVTKISSDKSETNIPVYDIKKGDRLLIRNQELLPVDAILISEKAKIDYSFVTGESQPVTKQSGDKLFAGGKQCEGAIEVEAIATVSQSYLTQLWSNKTFSKDKTQGFKTLTDAVSKYFTIALLLIAFVATTYWIFTDSSKAIGVLTAILIVACPCALALSAPFTLGNMLRIYGQKKFYLKNAQVIERLAQINTVIFDKTGTITKSQESAITYHGEPLTKQEEALLRSSLRNSNHPLSRQLYSLLKEHNIVSLNHFNEYTGKGIEAAKDGASVKIGSEQFVTGKTSSQTALQTAVHISTNNNYKGKYTFYNKYRPGIAKLFKALKKQYDLAILSGDNESERENLKKILPTKAKILFNQKPDDKLNYIAYHQKEGANIMMVGDGLNDAGALQQSNVGVAVSENVNVFSPACDAILDANKLTSLASYLWASKKAVQVIKASFVLSFLYNIVGLYFAVTGKLSPVIAAILMPLSSITIVVFTTVMTNLIGRKLK